MTARFSTLAPEAAAKITRRTAALSVGVAILLIILKAGAWFVSGSVAMLSSLADSALDFAASLFTMFAVRYAATPPDREHRFGHGKAEAFAGLFQAGLVAISAVMIVIEAVHRLLNPVALTHETAAIVVMLVSIGATGALVWAQTRAIAATGSLATSGDRAHYGADLAANIVVILGIVAAASFGWTWADGAAGILIALWLAWGAWQVARGAADHLMDHEMPAEDRARIRALAMEGGRIVGVHDLRTRMSGPYVHVQFHADMAPDLTLDEAHHIIVEAEKRIRAAYPAADLIIHPDPGDRAEPHGLDYFAEGARASRS
jgi:cation diffusion facilitator family transporter